jgi:hypothetical protein
VHSLIDAEAAGFVPVDLGVGVHAGFTTRVGGVSEGPWGTLNLGLSTGDDPFVVRANRRRIADAVGCPVAYATQVHGREVVEIDDVHRSGPAAADTVGEADALVAHVGQGVAVVAADCVPILLADPDARLVAAVHAGRRGVVDGVVRAAVERLVALGASRGRLRAAIGPSICGRCYEVPASMRDDVCDCVPQAWSTTRQGTCGLDLPAGVRTQLGAVGVTQVVETGICTFEDERFYSYRRDGTSTGRFAGVVAHVGTRRAA